LGCGELVQGLSLDPVRSHSLIDVGGHRREGKEKRIGVASAAIDRFTCPLSSQVFTDLETVHAEMTALLEHFGHFGDIPDADVESLSDCLLRDVALPGIVLPVLADENCDPDRHCWHVGIVVDHLDPTQPSNRVNLDAVPASRAHGRDSCCATVARLAGIGTLFLAISAPATIAGAGFFHRDAGRIFARGRFSCRARMERMVINVFRPSLTASSSPRPRAS
jgi:hypothetical protein